MANTAGISLRTELEKIVPPHNVDRRIDQYYNALEQGKDVNIPDFLSFVKECEKMPRVALP